MFSSTHIAQLAADSYQVHMIRSTLVRNFTGLSAALQCQEELETLLVFARGPLNGSAVIEHGSPEALVAWLLKAEGVVESDDREHPLLTEVPALTFHEAAAWLQA